MCFSEERFQVQAKQLEATIGQMIIPPFKKAIFQQLIGPNVTVSTTESPINFLKLLVPPMLTQHVISQTNLCPLRKYVLAYETTTVEEIQTFLAVNI
jgi:hypothetical protein